MLSVRARAAHLATFRGVMVRLMEMLARWVPITPEMEVKVLFGQHIWDVAQHANGLGLRAHELRSSLHFTLAPAGAYARVLEEVAAADTTAARLVGFYDVVLAGLTVRYRAYLRQSDDLLDAPSFRVIEEILRDFDRMRSDCDALRRELPALGPADDPWRARLAAAEAAPAEILQGEASAAGGTA